VADDKGAGRSVPVWLEIPDLGVRAGVVPIGLRPDGTLDVPTPRPDAPAAWYERSPTPGENGSSVIVGPGSAFDRLRLLRPGDELMVGRADGSVIHFTVTRIALYPTTHLPAEQAHGPSDHPTLTLLTSGGRPDLNHGSTPHNLLVFAHRAAP
jgi:sortase (surface protein transpeptidase)